MADVKNAEQVLKEWYINEPDLDIMQWNDYRKQHTCKRLIAAMDEYASQQTSLLREENKRLRATLEHIANSPHPCNEFEFHIWHDTARQEANESLLQSNIEIQNDKKETK